MNDNDFKDKSSLYILGKEFIIVIVVIFSALSFTLGYFVGKSGRDKKSEPVSQTAEITPLPQKQETLPIQSAKEEGNDQSEGARNDREKLSSGKIIYTVQLGAFKNASEAEKFKAKYDKKGYTTYITIFKNNRNEKIYKVRMGKFKTRKDAEIFSLKLKKTEGLTTFVTFKTE